ncbi:MAG: nitroreductase family protein, partial [Burkholderiales bacterium]
MREELEKAFNFRHACKLFDEGRSIPAEDLGLILDAGILSPSSFGMEHWKFIVVSGRENKEKLKAACDNQDPLSTCSVAIVILAKKSELSPNNRYAGNQLMRMAGGS